MGSINNLTVCIDYSIEEVVIVGKYYHSIITLMLLWVGTGYTPQG